MKIVIKIIMVIIIIFVVIVDIELCKKLTCQRTLIRMGNEKNTNDQPLLLLLLLLFTKQINQK